MKRLPTLKPAEGGFSLIELMVVVSIMSLLSGLAITPLNRLKINAARAEMAQNFRIFTAYGTSAYADTGTAILGAGIGWFNVGEGPTTPYNCNFASMLAIAFENSDCPKLRYWYRIVVNADGTVITTAQAGRGGFITYGSRPIISTRFCAKNAYRYDDYWQSANNSVPVVTSDITNQCL